MKKSFLSCVAILMAFVFNVSVVAQTAPTLEKLTDDSNEIYHYYLPQGVAVDKNPASPYYGYTYVAAATDGASDGGSDRADTQKRGIFVYDAELNSLNPDNVGFLPANAAELMTDASRQAMHRVAVNPVNNHVVFCYNVAGATAVWSMDPANLAGEAVNLIEGLAITKANALCFDAEGTLYVMDNANTTDGGKLVKVVNGELVPIVQHATWANQDIALAADGRGGVWVAQHRSQIDTYALLAHVNAVGEIDFLVNSKADATLIDLFPVNNGNPAHRGQCAYNVEKDILAFGGNKVVSLFQVTYDELTGVPSLVRLAETDVISNNIDGVDFYANGDLAVASASAERFAKYAVTYPSEEEPENPEEPEIEWIEMPLEIANLTTEAMEVEGATYLLLQGRDDMNDADVMLFLNDYTGEDKEYEVNAESSYMTFGGMELTVLDGKMAQTENTYTGIVHATVTDEEIGGTMYVEFALTMYAAAATELVLTDAIVAINEELGTLTFNVPTEEGGYFVELSGYTAPGVHEGPQICLFETPEAVAYANYVETVVEGGVITLTGEFTSFMGAKFNVTISGKLPVVEPENPEVELPAANVRAWAYDLALAVEGDQYTFSYKATTAAKATLILTDAEGAELDAVDLGLVEAGANTAVLAASELPAGQEVTWAVKLEAGAIAEFTEVTDASRGIYNFYLPQGVAVDNNPESATFGTIYVAAATDGASDGGSDRADTQKRGIFIYDQELNELNPTSNVGIVPSNVTFGATSRQVMKRLVINPATNEVAFAHNADPMAVWAVPTENVGGEAKNLIEGLGFTNVNSICFTEDGTLYVLESNGYPAPGSLYKVANGVVDTIFAGNTRFGNGDNALVSDNRGGVWICQNRGQLDTYNQLTHVNAAGEIDFEVNTATPNGFESMNTARGTIAYNPAEDILAMSIGTGSTIGASLYKVTYDEATGVPALTLIGSTPSMGKNVDGLAFDYAGDLYGLSANKERLYKYAVPTDNNVCTTPAAAKYAFQIEGSDTPDQGLTLTATGLETQLEGDGSYTLQGLAVVNGDESNLMDFMLCVYPTEGYTDAFLNGWSVMIFGAPTPGAFVDNGDGTFTYTAQIEDTYGDGTVYNINMSGTIKTIEGPEYTELEDQITNLVFDFENMLLIGGPSENFEIEVVLGLGEDNFDGSFTLSDESSVAIRGIDAEFIEGYVYDIDVNAPSATAVVKVNWDGMYYAFTLTMTAAPAEATKVVVENATVEVEKYLLFGDTYDYSLKMTGNWTNEADGITYPVLVEVPVYYPEATEPFSILSTVTVGGMGDNDPWLGFGEGELTVTTVGNTVTATGVVENPMAGVAIDITISGELKGDGTGLENTTVTVKSVKTIKNGQLIINRDGKEYNAQGAILK